MNPPPVVIITGASKGVGAATARWLGTAGACVALVARSEQRLRTEAEAVGRLGGKALAVAADVADPEACRRTVEKVADTFGGIDALVNNAGILQPLAPVATADPGKWRYNIEVNVLGPFYLVQAALALLKARGGRVVNVSSGAAGRVIRAASAYCASKAALTHFTAILAAEEPGITAISVRPGVVDTAMQDTLRSEGPAVMPAEDARFYQDLHREGRLEPPRVPGRSIAWLALHAPREWSGSFLNYDDPDIMAPALEVFGPDFQSLEPLNP